MRKDQFGSRDIWVEFGHDRIGRAPSLIVALAESLPRRPADMVDLLFGQFGEQRQRKGPGRLVLGDREGASLISKVRISRLQVDGPRIVDARLDPGFRKLDPDAVPVRDLDRKDMMDLTAPRVRHRV